MLNSEQQNNGNILCSAVRYSDPHCILILDIFGLLPEPRLQCTFSAVPQEGVPPSNSSTADLSKLEFLSQSRQGISIKIKTKF